MTDGVTPGSPLLSDGITVYTGSDSLRRNGATTFFTGDLLGSAEDTSDGTGASPSHVVEYDPFGNVLAGTGSAVGSPFRYCGAAGYQTSPDSGLILAGSRWYDPAIGRFLTRDPAGSGDNPYAYCGNNPVSNMDPLGLQSTSSETPSNPISAVAGVAIAAGVAVVADLTDDFSHLFGGGGGSHNRPSGESHFGSASKPAQGGFVFNLTNGPDGGGFSGVMNNLFDAHTYGLPYAGFLAGTDYIGDYGGPIATQLALGLVSDGLEPVFAGVGEVSGLSAAHAFGDVSGMSLGNILDKLDSLGFTEKPLGAGSSVQNVIFSNADGSKVTIDLLNEVVKVNGPKVWATPPTHKWAPRIGAHNQPFLPW